MESTEINKEHEKEHAEMWKDWEKGHRRGKIFGGIMIVLGGALFLAKELGAEIPVWVFTWKTALVAIGLIVGVRHGFRNPGWLALIIVGGVFMLTDIYPDLHIKPLIWPLVIIFIGLLVIFKPRRKYHHHWKKWQRHHFRHYERHYQQYQNYQHQYDHHHNPFDRRGDGTNSDDYLDTTLMFGSIQKNIISKNFKGGDVTVIFGGVELNLSQADFEGQVTLELTQVLGGTKLIVPPNWEIKSELVSIMAGIEDKRPVMPNTSVDPNKVLMLRGNVIMGGIEIKSY